MKNQIDAIDAIPQGTPGVGFEVVPKSFDDLVEDCATGSGSVIHRWNERPTESFRKSDGRAKRRSIAARREEFFPAPDAKGVETCTVIGKGVGLVEEAGENDTWEAHGDRLTALPVFLRYAQ